MRQRWDKWWEGAQAHGRLNEGNIAAEQERYGVHSGDEPAMPIPLRWITEKEALHIYGQEPTILRVSSLPRDNPRHRERHGLEGAFDASCQDVCCKPLPAWAHSIACDLLREDDEDWSQPRRCTCK